MRRLTRTSLLLLTLSLLLAACAAPTASPTVDRGPWTLTPTVYSPPSTLTPTVYSPPSTVTLSDLGLPADLAQTLQTRQGWNFEWDAARDVYAITQRRWDENQTAFTTSTLGEVGYIDREGNLHLYTTSFTAVPGKESAFVASQTNSEITISLNSSSVNSEATATATATQTSTPTATPEATTTKTPTATPEATATANPQENNATETALGPFTFIETKNPLFEKTGILKFEANGVTYVYSAPSAQTSERQINGKTVKVVEFASLQKNEQGVMAMTLDTLHTGFPVAWLIANGYDKPFPQEAVKNFPTWAIQFHYHPENQTKDAMLWPRSGETSKYFRYLEDENGEPTYLFIIGPQGESYLTIPFLTLNPADPKNPQADETMFLFGALGTVNVAQFEEAKRILLNPSNHMLSNLFRRQTTIYLAQEGGYWASAQGGYWSKFFNTAPLDQLLGMEGNDVRNNNVIMPDGYKFNLGDLIDYGNKQVEKEPKHVFELVIYDNNGIIIPFRLDGLMQLDFFGLGF